MLSLKSVSSQPRPKSAQFLTDLPVEILDLIIKHIYQSSGNHLDSIFPVSRTCRNLRASTYPILFEKLSLKAQQDIIKKQSWALLNHLVSRPQLLKHVRHLEIQVAVDMSHPPNPTEVRSAYVGQRISRKLLSQCMTLMTGLRSLKIHNLSDLSFEILQQLCTIHNIHISIDLSDFELCLFDDAQNLRLQHTISSAPAWVCALSLPRFKFSQNLIDVLEIVTPGKVDALDWHDNWATIHRLVSRGHQLPYLQELHVSSKILLAQTPLLQPGIIPWPTLKRLHVEGDREIKHLLSSVIEKLTSLEDLRLHSLSSVAFHDHCLDTRHRPPREYFPWTRLPSLRHLSLRGICLHIPLCYLTTPYLQTLILILPEYSARLSGLKDARPASEIQWIARNLPHLTHLEIHTGSLENLWHPTAIAGIDVDMEVYLVLKALTEIKHLTTLRLFPPYVPSNRRHDYLNARQPLSDEQAVRIFHFLHAARPSLHTLSIAATFYALRGFSPMSWLVRDNGGNSRTILSTRQAGKDYELVQHWSGERRLRMENKRHSFRRPYLPDLRGGWVFPVEDPPGPR